MVILNPLSGKKPLKMQQGAVVIPADNTEVSVQTSAPIAYFFACIRFYMSSSTYYLPFFNSSSPHKGRYDGDGGRKLSTTQTTITAKGSAGDSLDYWIFTQ